MFYAVEKIKVIRLKIKFNSHYTEIAFARFSTIADSLFYIYEFETGQEQLM